jgi:hypothetical protein
MDWFFMQRLSWRGPRFIFFAFPYCHHAGSAIARAATLTCHFFELPAPEIRALAIRMIELCRKALLVDPVGLASLPQTPLAAAFLAAVALAPIT